MTIFTHSVEIEIARNIFERIETKYLLRVPQTEINFFGTMYINNHSNFRNYRLYLRGSKRVYFVCFGKNQMNPIQLIFALM